MFLVMCETGLTYYGARYYQNRLSIWLSVDAMSGKGPNITPYSFTHGNPVNMIDPDGNWPISLMIFSKDVGLYGGYRLNEPTVHLLSLVSGVDKMMIQTATIQERAAGQYRPWYSSDKGGGAITLGTSSYGASITFTPNWFEDDATEYEGHGYGQNVYKWLKLLSHEVGHIPQIDEAGGFFSYVSEFIVQYISAGDHDGAPNEEEADIGSDTFVAFNAFVDKKYGQNKLIDLMSATEEDDGYYGTDFYKIKMIDLYWEEYQKTLDEEL